MRVTDGLWKDRDGYKVHRVEEVFRYKAEDKVVDCMVPCHEIRTMKDTIFGPVLHVVFSAPREDMISVKITHYTGKLDKGPYFDLEKTNPDIQIIENEETVEMINGKMKAVIYVKGAFHYDFYYEGQFLTGSGERCASYVTDVDYEADKWQDFNGRKKRPYNKETFVRDMLSLDVGEYIYGFGEQFSPFVKNGQMIDIWNRDAGSNCNQGYKNIPFYLSNKNYALLVNTPDRVQFEVGRTSVRHIDFSIEGESMEYIIIGGSQPKEILSKYTAMIGRTPVPPAETFGLWLSTSWMPDSDEKITIDTIEKMQSLGIPLNVFHFDARWMDDYSCCDFVWSKRFGDVKSLLQKIHDHGVKVCVWINSYVSQESYLFEEGKENGYFIKDKEGNVWQSDEWMNGIAIVDFTNPAATRWYMDKLGEVLDVGVDYIKTDFGERIPTDVVFYDGSDPRKMHNYYPYLYNEAVYNLIEERKGKGEACVFSRSSTVGTQKFPVNWGGDCQASYISMAESLRGGLSFCQSGYGYWSHDISGFVGTATPDLYKRWSAFGLLSTHSRLHGEESYRAPWYFDDECCEVLKTFAKLKCSLMPYLYANAVNLNKTGEPVMRAMMLEYPNDRNCQYLDRQYMLGDKLLVAPIFNDESMGEFYVPEGGTWTDFLTGQTYEGGSWYKQTYDYFHLPLLVPANSMIPVGKDDTKSVYDFTDGVTFRIFGLEEGKSCSCTVYDFHCENPVTATATKKDGVVKIVVDKKGNYNVEVVGGRSVSFTESAEF